MKRVFLVSSLICSTFAFAGSIEVPLGGRAALKPGRAIDSVTVRDPSLVVVVVTDGAVSLEGRKSGVSGVLVKYADGELERMLVVVGDSLPSTGPRMEREQVVDLKPLKSATARAKPVEAPAVKAKKRDRATIDEAAGVVRAAVERL